MTTPLQTITLPVLTAAETPREAMGWIEHLNERGGTALQAVRRVRRDDLAVLRGKGRRLADVTEELKAAILYSERERLEKAIRATSTWQSGPGAISYAFDGKTLPELRQAARHARAGLLNRALGKARLVVWIQGYNALPAVFCPDIETAAFALLVTGTTRLCANAKCRVPFEPKRGQKYHSDACGIAARTRKSREKKRIREAVAAQRNVN